MQSVSDYPLKAGDHSVCEFSNININFPGCAIFSIIFIMMCLKAKIISDAHIIKNEIYNV